jgi:hypothetical protein
MSVLIFVSKIFVKKTKERAYHVNEIFSQKIIVTTEMAIIFCTAMRQKKVFLSTPQKLLFSTLTDLFPKQTNETNPTDEKLKALRRSINSTNRN